MGSSEKLTKYVHSYVVCNKGQSVASILSKGSSNLSSEMHLFSVDAQSR